MTAVYYVLHLSVDPFAAKTCRAAPAPKTEHTVVGFTLRQTDVTQAIA